MASHAEGDAAAVAVVAVAVPGPAASPAESLLAQSFS